MWRPPSSVVVRPLHFLACQLSNNYFCQEQWLYWYSMAAARRRHRRIQKLNLTCTVSAQASVVGSKSCVDIYQDLPVRFTKPTAESVQRPCPSFGVKGDLVLVEKAFNTVILICHVREKLTWRGGLLWCYSTWKLQEDIITHNQFFCIYARKPFAWISEASRQPSNEQ